MSFRYENILRFKFTQQHGAERGVPAVLARNYNIVKPFGIFQFVKQRALSACVGAAAQQRDVVTFLNLDGVPVPETVNRENRGVIRREVCDRPSNRKCQRGYRHGGKHVEPFAVKDISRSGQSCGNRDPDVIKRFVCSDAAKREL